MLEFDLSGAEWVVVAYLSGDPNMLGVVKSGKSPHVVTGSLIAGVPEDLVIKEHNIVGSHSDETTIYKLRLTGVPELLEMQEQGSIFLPRVMSIRQAGKKSNHGLNYNMKYRRFALENEIPEADALPLVEAYTEKAYPGIPKWHEAIRQELRDNDRTLFNCFGRKVRLLGEWGMDLFDQAYSFKPQSTVVDLALEAMCLIYENESPWFRQVMLSAQVHDSIMLQHPIPTTLKGWLDLAKVVQDIKGYLSRPMVYGEHEFSLGVDLKMGFNWGDMAKCKILDDIDSMSLSLRMCVADLQVAFAAASALSEIRGQTVQEQPPRHLEESFEPDFEMSEPEDYRTSPLEIPQ